MNGLRSVLGLVLILGGIALIAATGDRPAFDLLGVGTEVVAGVLFGVNFVRTARCRA